MKIVLHVYSGLKVDRLICLNNSYDMIIYSTKHTSRCSHHESS